MIVYKIEINNNNQENQEKSINNNNNEKKEKIPEKDIIDELIEKIRKNVKWRKIAFNIRTID